MGSSFVYAVRTRLQTKTDARSNTTIGTGAKKRTRTGDSESNKRTRLNPSEAAAGERPTGMSTSEANARSEYSRISPESRRDPRENRWYVIDNVLCTAYKQYRIFLRIVDLYRKLCTKHIYCARINLANPREDGNMPDMIELVLNSIKYQCERKENKAFKELADYIRKNGRLLLDPTQCSMGFFSALYRCFEKWAKDFYHRNGLQLYKSVMPTVIY